MKTQMLHMDHIIRDSSLQVRTKTDLATVKRYALALQNGQGFPPVRVALIGGKQLLVDGWHRLEAMRMIGEYQIEALVEPMTTMEATWEAAKANLTHGLPLKGAEKLAVFRAYMKSGQYKEGSRLKSYRVIAQELGGIASHMTVARWMGKHYPKIAMAMGTPQEHRVDSFTAPEVDRDPEHLGQALQGLADSLNHYQLLDSLSSRGEVITQLEENLRAMEGMGYEVPF